MKERKKKNVKGLLIYDDVKRKKKKEKGIGFDVREVQAAN